MKPPSVQFRVEKGLFLRWIKGGINTTRPLRVGWCIEIISRDLIEMPQMSAHKWLDFSSFSSQTDGASNPLPAGPGVGSPNLLSMTQICQFIFSGPFVKWDLHSTARCSHKRHYGLITSRSCAGDKCALFPLHSAVHSHWGQICYILLQNHTRFSLAAQRGRKPTRGSRKGCSVYGLGFRVRHARDCLLLIRSGGKWALNLRRSASSESRDAASAYNSATATRSWWIKMRNHGWIRAFTL